MASLSELAEMLVKRIKDLTRTATSSDLTDGEFVAVDKTDGYTRKMTVANLATWIHNKWAVFVDGRTSTASFASNDAISVSNPTNGTRKMSKDTLLQITSNNALADNVAPLFDPNKPNDAGGYAYYAGNNVTYEGQNFVFIANHVQGPWNPLEVEQKPLSESINLQGVGEAVDEWLNNHPEATTTVPDGSLTKEKFSDLLQQECLNDYVTPEMFGAVGNGTADDTAAVQACLDYAFANSKSTYLSKTYKITASLDVHDWCVIRGNGGTKRKSETWYNIRFSPGSSTSFENPMPLFVCNDTTIRRRHHSFIDVSIFKVSGKAICFGNTCKIDRNSIITDCYISTFDIVIDGKVGHLVRIERNTFYAVCVAFVSGSIDDSYIINNYISGYRPFAPVCFEGSIYHSEISDNFFDFWFGIFRNVFDSRIANNIFDYCFWIFGYTLYYNYTTWKPAEINKVTITGNVLANCVNCHTDSEGFGSVLSAIANAPDGAFKVKLLTDWFPSAFCIAYFMYDETTDTISCKSYYTPMAGSITGNVFDGGIVLKCMPAGLIMKGNTYLSINSTVSVEEQPRVCIGFVQHTSPAIYDKHLTTEIDLFDHMQFAHKPALFMTHTIFGAFQLFVEGGTVWYDKKLYKGYWAPGVNNFHFYDVTGNLLE